ncbi:hypothetical protein D3C77_216230 [compost metagenome]
MRPAGAGAWRKVAGDPVAHLITRALVLAAHAPQVRLVVTTFDKVGNRQLRLGCGAASADVLHVQHPLQIAPRCGPSDAQAWGQGFGERTAEQHPTVFVERLDSPRTRVGVGEVAIHVVFEDRHVKALSQRQQSFLTCLGHDVAERIIAVRGDLDELDRPLFQRQFQGLEADAGDRVGWNLQGFHTQALEGLHGTMKAWRIHCDDIAGLTHRADAGRQCFVTTGGHDQVSGAYRAAGVEHQAGDLLAQGLGTGDGVVIQAGHVLAPTELGQAAQ